MPNKFKGNLCQDNSAAVFFSSSQIKKHCMSKVDILFPILFIYIFITCSLFKCLYFDLLIVFRLLSEAFALSVPRRPHTYLIWSGVGIPSRVLRRQRTWLRQLQATLSVASSPQLIPKPAHVKALHTGIIPALCCRLDMDTLSPACVSMEM